MDKKSRKNASVASTLNQMPCSFSAGTEALTVGGKGRMKIRISRLRVMLKAQCRCVM